MMWVGVAVLCFVTAQRAAELVLAERNTRRLMRSGAIEAGRGHYPVMILLHAAWLGSLWIFAPGQPVSLAWLAVFAVLQLLRLWVLVTLGRRWTTRIISVPGETLIAHGPYAYVSHPNYLVVAAEVFVLPAAFGLWFMAVLFTGANAAMLYWRIRVENTALGRQKH